MLDQVLNVLGAGLLDLLAVHHLDWCGRGKDRALHARAGDGDLLDVVVDELVATSSVITEGILALNDAFVPVGHLTFGAGLDAFGAGLDACLQVQAPTDATFRVGRRPRIHRPLGFVAELVVGTPLEVIQAAFIERRVLRLSAV